MSTVPQHLIEEARRKNIRKDAIIQCAVATNRSGTVKDEAHWYLSTRGSLIVGNDDQGGCLFATDNTTEPATWARIITPAPSQGLQEGDAVECSRKMQEAIVERWTDLGMKSASQITACTGSALLVENGLLWSTSRSGDKGETWLSVPEFLSRLEATKPAVPVIKIGGSEVKFGPEEITVKVEGRDALISSATVLAVAQRMEGNKIDKKPDWKSLSGSMAYFPSAALAKAAHSRILELGAHCKCHMGEAGSTRYLYFNANDGNINGGSCSDLNLIPYGAFMDAIEALVPKVEDIVIEGRIVKFEDEHIVVGCQRIPKQTVRDIAERLKRTA